MEKGGIGGHASRYAQIAWALPYTLMIVSHDGQCVYTS